MNNKSLHVYTTYDIIHMQQRNFKKKREQVEDHCIINAVVLFCAKKKG